MNLKKKILAALAGVAALTQVVNAQLETRFDGGVGGAAQTEAAVLFGAVPGQTVVSSLNAWSDKAAAQLKLYTRGGAGRIAISASSTALATVVWCDNADSGLATSDKVVVQHANGLAEYATLAGASTTNVTISAGTTYACAVGDYIYEVTQAGQFYVGSNTALNIAGDVFATPGDSPLYATLDATSNVVLSVTVGR